MTFDRSWLPSREDGSSTKEVEHLLRSWKRGREWTINGAAMGRKESRTGGSDGLGSPEVPRGEVKPGWEKC